MLQIQMEIQQRQLKRGRRFPGSAQYDQETRHEIIEWNQLRKLLEADEVLKEVIQWAVAGKAPHMQELELRSKVHRSYDNETYLQSYGA